MKKLSTGEDSTLENYRKIAETFGEKAVAFIDKKISNSPNGEREEVIAAESQILMVFAGLSG